MATTTLDIQATTELEEKFDPEMRFRPTVAAGDDDRQARC